MSGPPPGNSRRDRAWRVAACAVLVCAAIEVYTLADRSRGEPRNEDIRRYVLGELFDGHRVEQRFVVKANGLSSVTIHPRSTLDNPPGSLVLELRDVTDDRDNGVVQQTSVPLASLAHSGAMTLQFPSQPSLYREYALVVTVKDGPRKRGIGLLASRGEGYGAARLTVDGGRARFGDLIFETTVDTARSNFGSIRSTLAAGGVPVAGFVLVVVLLAKNGVLFFIIREAATHFSAMAAPEDRVAPPVPEPPDRI